MNVRRPDRLTHQPRPLRQETGLIVSFSRATMLAYEFVDDCSKFVVLTPSHLSVTEKLAWFIRHLSDGLYLFIYSIQICEISHQTLGPSHRKCRMIFVNTGIFLNIWHCAACCTLGCCHSGLQQSARRHMRVSEGDEKSCLLWRLAYVAWWIVARLCDAAPFCAPD